MGKQIIRCMGCMRTFSSEYDMCPHCGYEVNTGVENALHMEPGTLLAGRYIIGRVVGYGGFGVTYIAWDKTLQQRVAIKEYLPSEFSTRAAGQTMVTVFSGDKTIQFQDGMEKFVEEAKRLAKFQNDNGIVRVFDSLEDNNTAYIVMEYLEGETLAQLLEREHTLHADQAIPLIMPVIRALASVHEKGIIHRDIAPDNVFLTTDGKVKLIDFGAARYATTTKSRSLTVIIKPGYSPEEQYRSRGDQGAHTDVYSVGAILYRMITGETPPDALERRAFLEKSKKDILPPIQKFDKSISPNQRNAIYNAMNVLIEDRTPDMQTLEYELTTADKVMRRGSTIRKTDPLTWPIWAKLGVPSAIVAVTVLIVLLSVGVIGPRSDLNRSMVIPDGQTLIPNVVAKDTDVAEKRLQKNDLGFLIANKIENDVIKKNKILTQDPDAGYVTDKGTIVNVIISAGRGDRVVPCVTEMFFDEAKAQLEEIGFIVEKKEKKSEEALGVVVSQSVGENETLEIGSTIVLTVSKGNNKFDTGEKVIIPNFVGMDKEAAKEYADSMKLSLVVTEYTYHDTVPENQIIEQTPKAGQSGMTGDSIEITVSRGFAKAVVPDLYGMEQNAAIQLLKERGVKYTVRHGTDTRVNIGVVFAQSVPGDTQIDKKTTIVITVCNNNPMLNNSTEQGKGSASSSSTTSSTSPKGPGFSYLNPSVGGSKDQSTKTTTTRPTTTTTTTTTTTKPTTTTTTTTPINNSDSINPNNGYRPVENDNSNSTNPSTQSQFQGKVVNVLNGNAYTIRNENYTIYVKNGKTVVLDKQTGQKLYEDSTLNREMILKEVKNEILHMLDGYEYTGGQGLMETYRKGRSSVTVYYTTNGLRAIANYDISVEPGVDDSMF